MLSILVAHSYFLRFDRKQQERAKPYPPLATLHVASMLRQAGHTVRVFDAMLAEGLDEYEQLLADMRPQLVLLYEDSFNFLSKMCLERMRQASCQMISKARQDGARVIAVGSDASDTPEPYLRAGADTVLFGEGLQSLQALSERLDTNPSLPISSLIEGLGDLAAVLGGQLKVFKNAHPSPSRRQMDPPAWDLIDIERYRTVWQRAHGFFSLNMAASRGCSFRALF